MNNKINDSVLDFPQTTLCPDIWQENEDNTFSLTQEAQSTIKTLVDFMIEKFNIPHCKVNITGSITSNSYTDDADIDVHFQSKSFISSKQDEFNKLFRKAFDEEFKPSNNWHIKSHPLEVYFQANPFQDLMSIGCYSFTEQKWLVGPELTDPAFNPYSEYYKDIQKQARSFINKVRGSILETYELAVTLKEMEGHEDEIYNDVLKMFQSKLEAAGKVFEIVRKSRKAMSTPTTKEQALKLRKDHKWHVADATFKLLNKFGYLAILKAMSSKEDPKSMIDNVLNAITDNMAN